ncbi:MAG TPA: hypothetical protein VGV37_06385 [Aliidongia sp.]|uniref:hypothetical protein n=1 Tax=Aliidongia sp. TaxID=1914230 RepID=UPI002DDCDD46|nr:hypothetical protein [Aliidongia sp.]HEV2674153.1 hypothetical protein [Aliidongia sp.]
MAETILGTRDDSLLTHVERLNGFRQFQGLEDEPMNEAQFAQLIAILTPISEFAQKALDQINTGRLPEPNDEPLAPLASDHAGTELTDVHSMAAGESLPVPTHEEVVNEPVVLAPRAETIVPPVPVEEPHPNAVADNPA